MEIMKELKDKFDVKDIKIKENTNLIKEHQELMLKEFDECYAAWNLEMDRLIVSAVEERNRKIMDLFQLNKLALEL